MIKIRRASIDDLQIIQELNSGSFENDAINDPYLIMTWPFDEDTGKAYFIHRITSDEGICLVAEDNHHVVGYLAGAIRSNETYRSGTRSELENMFVREDARRAGVGTALIDAFKQWSIDNNADELYVSAYFGNDRAVTFYKSNGFASYSHDLLLDLRKK